MTSRPVVRAGYAAMIMATALIASVLLPGAVAAQSNPTPDRVWAGCTLNQAEVDALINRMTQSSGGGQLGTPKQVAFIVIHSLQENNGQPRGSGFTGPVICRAPGVSINEVEQTTTIPRDGSPVDLLDQQSGMSVLYRHPSGSTNPDDNKKRFCWTVASSADCFDFE